MSASRSRSPAEMWLPNAMPMLAVIRSVPRGASSISNGSRSTSSRRSATNSGLPVGAPPSTSTTNSSPPRRAIVSASRSVAESRAATDSQEPVAGFVPERVVHLLEAVEVDEQRRALDVAPAGPGEHLLDPVEDQRAVREPGERVVQRLVPDALEQAGVADRDRGLAREPAQPVGHVGVVAAGARAGRRRRRPRGRPDRR